MSAGKWIKLAGLPALVIIAVSSAALLGARAQDQRRRGEQAAMTSTIAFVSTRHAPPQGDSPLHASQIYLMDGDGSNVRRLTENAHMDNFPALSPDGKKIVFHRRVGGRGQFQLFMINADGTGERQMTNPPGLSGFPNWGEVRGRGPAK
jgi:hypothetical protein